MFETNTIGYRALNLHDDYCMTDKHLRIWKAEIHKRNLVMSPVTVPY